MKEFSQVSVDLSTVHFWSWALAWTLVAAVLFFGRLRDRILRFSRISIVAALAILAVAAILPAGLGRVQPGARGVVLRFGAPTGRVAGEGLYYVVPLVERVVQVNTQVNTVRFDRAQATCHDLEPVYADLAVSFHVVPADVIDVYTLLRNNYAQRIVTPAVEDAWKATAANYTSSDLIAQRSSVQNDFENAVRSRLAKFGLGLDAIATTRFNFSYAYAHAAQEKVASVQRTLQAKQDLQRIRFESQQSVIRAKSEVDALKLQRNIPVAQLIRMREIDLQRRAIEKWDGHLPATTGTLPFLGSTLQPHQD
jgi:regulator of protease activity HflC (stomatin/prohibitin superfamily)